MTTSFFDTTTNLWSDAFLAGRGGDLVDDEDGNNNAIFAQSVMVRTQGQCQPQFLIQQPTCGRMHSWQGGGGDLDNDDDINNNHKDEDKERGQQQRHQR